MTIIAWCMTALALFILLIVFLVLVWDARELTRQADRHKENRKAILREISERKEEDDAIWRLGKG